MTDGEWDESHVGCVFPSVHFNSRFIFLFALYFSILGAIFIYWSSVLGSFWSGRAVGALLLLVVTLINEEPTSVFLSVPRRLIKVWANGSPVSVLTVGCCDWSSALSLSSRSTLSTTRWATTASLPPPSTWWSEPSPAARWSSTSGGWVALRTLRSHFWLVNNAPPTPKKSVL